MITAGIYLVGKIVAVALIFSATVAVFIIAVLLVRWIVELVRSI